ncbi:MAG: hypothetical protein IPJ82_25100 [Lewinellaceae bacterium]|nr:hypothetical protein [Lewinellaceae bacterium]
MMIYFLQTYKFSYSDVHLPAHQPREQGVTQGSEGAGFLIAFSFIVYPNIFSQFRKPEPAFWEGDKIWQDHQFEQV